MRALRALDRAMWRLPRRVRRVIAAPVILVTATLYAQEAARKEWSREWSREWRSGMAHVDERPGDSESYRGASGRL